jgi:hypothetical protein
MIVHVQFSANQGREQRSAFYLWTLPPPRHPIEPIPVGIADGRVGGTIGSSFPPKGPLSIGKATIGTTDGIGRNSRCASGKRLLRLIEIAQ